MMKTYLANITIIIGFITILTFTNCSMPENKNVQNQTILEIEEPDTDSIVQDSTTILGDKILWSPTIDLYGLKSPDTIYLINEFYDSIDAVNFIDKLQVSLNIIPNKGYFFIGMGKEYSVFSFSKPEISHEVKIIHKLRNNNFHDDKSLKPAQLKGAYRYYNVEKIKGENTFVITQKKAYNSARFFSRLIKFNSDSIQISSITINDFELTSYSKTSRGYLLGLNDFQHGANYFYFTDKLYSCKVLLLDNNLETIGEYHAHLESTHLVEVNQDHDGIYAVFELHLGCDQCVDSFCTYAVYFDTLFNPISVKIIAQPSGDETLSPDALLHCVKNKISFIDYWYRLN